MFKNDFIKGAHGLCIQNFKKKLKEVKEGLNKRRQSMVMDWKIMSLSLLVILSKVIYKFNEISINISAGFLSFFSFSRNEQTS